MSENPKDAIGRRKPRLSDTPLEPLWDIGRAMGTGAEKYGRFNWRASDIAASVYFDALLRHFFAWWRGEDADPESGLPHLAHCGANLLILMDGIAHGRMKDDRPKPAMIDVEFHALEAEEEDIPW